MPSVSRKQQRFFGMVDSYKKGKMPDASPTIKAAAASMTGKQVEDFASTPHKGLPEKSPNALRAAMAGKNRVVNRVAKMRRRLAA